MDLVEQRFDTLVPEKKHSTCKTECEINEFVQSFANCFQLYYCSVAWCGRIQLKVSLIYEIFRQESWLSRWWINEQVSLSTQMQIKNISTSSDNIGQNLKLGRYLYSLLSCFHPAACLSRVEIWCINLKRWIKSSQNSGQTKFLYSKNPQKPCM
jgi:hypothetical protein